MVTSFSTLDGLAARLRRDFARNRVVLLYAYNGSGKTRVSRRFKDLGRGADDRRDTLYFNAYTEDLFSWDNDLDADNERKLKLNASSRFFAGLEQFEMDNRIRPILQRFSDFDFRIDTTTWEVTFSREHSVTKNDGSVTTETIENIKISRGEERLFVWCFFLAILQLVLDGEDAYQWVKYVYIDDPVSSLDDNNTIVLGNHLSEMLHSANERLRVVLSTHHALFFDVMFNELRSGRKQWDVENQRTKRIKHRAYFLRPSNSGNSWDLLDQTSELPFFQHVALLPELKRAAETGELYGYHFNILRSVLEKTAAFHGYRNFSACLTRGEDDPDGTLHARYLNILSHGNYSLYEPLEMPDDNKKAFRNILNNFLARFAFNEALFSARPSGAAESGTTGQEA